MLRWHSSFCTNPVVSIEGSEVSCHSCSATYLFGQQSVRQNPATSLDIPEDRPLGQLRLRWPPAVPYTSDEELDNVHETSDIVRDPEKTRVLSEQYPQNVAHSATYRQLDMGEFRLICLDSTKSQSNLIHLDLEQYDLDNCPEYEATSYAWGGEDGDTQPSGAVFIGRFYDVALHTKNCLSLLRYLRPSRGIRMVWVDAICIDQANTHERELQIAEMRNIYRNATRVVVYLGPDTVLQRSQQHRRRANLEEIGAPGTEYILSINEILQHKYFSRVWVIQELLIAKSLLLPLNDFDYHANSRLIHSGNVEWVDEKAPWFRYIATGKSFRRDEIRSLLNETWASDATDPRDKLFGVLGLVDTSLCASKQHTERNPSPGMDYSLLPDYTLSMQETFIGLVSYILVALDQRDLLSNAAGKTAAPEYPTWIPDIRSPSIWRQASTTRDDVYYVQNWYKDMGLCCRQVWTIISAFGDIDIEWRYEEYRDDRIHEGRKGPLGTTISQEFRAMMTLGFPANNYISIDSSTAAMSIQWIRIIQLSSRPRLVLDSRTLRVFEFVMAEYSFLLCTEIVNLSLILDDTPTWMFLQEPGDDYGPSIFFLREANGKAGNSNYELICSCHCWDLLMFCRSRQADHRVVTVLGPQKGSKVHHKSRRSLTSGIIPMEHADDCVEFTRESRFAKLPSWGLPVPYETLYATTNKINLDAKIEHELAIVLPDHNIRVKDVLPLFQLLADAYSRQELDYHQFGELYVSMISHLSSLPCSMKSPCDIDSVCTPGDTRTSESQKSDRNIFVTVEPAMFYRYKQPWDLPGASSCDLSGVLVKQNVTKVKETDMKDSRYEMYFSERQDVIDSKWTLDATEWISGSMVHSKHFTINEEAPIFMCIPVSKIVKHMRETDLGKRFLNLTKFRGATGQDETAMAQSTEEGHRTILGHSWPESLREEIGLIGEPCRIQIV